ncbi:MAG: pyridoxal phosphate-dependent aminotransferase [Clostridiales bacterium]|nr:pyridoxal phosphate-dependent aminotransferase [Clostridiales bacterium]
MKYDFDTIVDRYNTGSVKYDTAERSGMPADVMPMWVADMDFRAPDEIVSRMRQLCDFGVFGYTMVTDSYFDAVRNWFSSRFDWEVERKWLVTTPGVVFALSAAVKAFTEPGEGVLIQRPVYYPFTEVVENNGRVVVNNSLRYDKGSYAIDYEDLEAKLARDDVKLMLICSPHNPVGRVWTRDELSKVCRLCLKYNVKMVSDEIHSDFVFSNREHVPLASLSEQVRENCVVCTAPSKSFNLAGLQISNIFIPNRDMRHAFRRELEKTGLFGVNMVGLCACQAAYESGGEWLDQLKEYLEGNIQFLKSFVNEHMPRIKVVDTEGTYLVWMDLQELNLVDQKDFIVNKARLWLDTGSMFGDEGRGFERINVACPRTVLEEALNRLKRAYDALTD